MYENMKSATLTVLVLLSLLLTWQIWTFQPDYALLQNTDYVENPNLNEERKISEVIVPEQVIFHVNNDHYRLHHKDPLYDLLSEQWLTSRIEDISIMSSHTMDQALERSIELTFPTEIPGDVFLSMFADVNEELSLSLSKVDRMFIYINSDTNKVHYWVVSNKDLRFVDIETSFSPDHFQDALAEAKNHMSVFSYQVGEQQGQWGQTIYLPKRVISVDSISYTYSSVSIDVFKQLLFNDPFSAKYFRQEDGEETYTDGNRLINIMNNGHFMDYINPIYSENPERGSRHVILSSIDFINGHGGWTDQYVLDDWISNNIREEVSFRLRLNGFPVVSMDGYDVMNLQVFRTGNQTSRYMRPLFDLDQQPIDYARTTVDLPSGYDVVDQLEQSDYFNLERVEKITVGYEMKKWNAFVTIEPNWYVYYDEMWQQVPFHVSNEREVEQHGLE